MSSFLPDGSYITVTHSWNNPYTRPENGLFHLWGAFFHCENRNAIREVTGKMKQIKGYGFHWAFGSIKAKKRWSAEAKAKRRKQLLVKRAQKKDPLFADFVIEKNLRENAEYFNPEKIKEFDKEFDKELKRRNEEQLQNFIENSIVCAKYEVMDIYEKKTHTHN